MAGANESSSIGNYFAVNVKTDCPHLKDALDESISVDIQAKCEDCENVGENWVCLKCSNVYCSRYVKEHMVAHNTESKHPIALSFSDASVWCYSCDAYIDAPVLKSICKSISIAKST